MGTGQPGPVRRAAHRDAAGPRDMRGLDFFENMLPEGPALARMAALAGVRPVDTYGILAAFGRDCAGAVMLLPDGEPPGAAGRGGYTPLTPAGLRQLINSLDAAPLGAAPERGFRPSLPGFQRKALLGRAADGTWQLPYGDAPSTWILKPDGPHPMAANESTCLRLAAACGLDAAQHRTARRGRAARARGQALRQAARPQAERSPSGCTRRTAARRPRCRQG